MRHISKITLYLLTALVFTMCTTKHEQGHSENNEYRCPMHSQIVRDKPGKCPICGMDLVKSGKAASNAIMLNESQIKLANITTSPARFERVGEQIVLSGKLMVNEEQTEVVSSRVAGRIEKLYLKEGGRTVTRGEPLYQIYSETLQTLQQEFLLANRQWTVLKEKRYESFMKACERKLLLFGMTKKQLETLALRNAADPRVTYLAPVSGFIEQMDAVEGTYVTEGSVLFRIGKLDQIWVEFASYSGESSLAQTGDSVRVVIDGYELAATKGKVTFINPEYQAGGQVTKMRAVIDNPHHEYRPGMQATVVLSRSEKIGISLPVDAVIHDAKGSHVWILENDGAFHPRMVKTGLENPEKVLIAAGIEENEKVVVTGAYLLYGELVLKKGADLMAGHEHKKLLH